MALQTISETFNGKALQYQCKCRFPTKEVSNKDAENLVKAKVRDLIEQFGDDRHPKVPPGYSYGYPCAVPAVELAIEDDHYVSLITIHLMRVNVEIM
jgi:hypothetical protein